MSKTIYLIRHGEVEESYQGRYIGTTNPNLSNSGKADCKKFEKLENIEKIYCSPLARAIETAAFIPCSNIEIVDELSELNFGIWENLTFDEISKICSQEEIDIWANNPDQMIFPNGECVKDFFARVENFFDKAKEFAEENFAVVTHGGVIMHILTKVHNLPSSRQREVSINRGNMVILQLDRGEWCQNET